jgi:hypothetical protein
MVQVIFFPAGQYIYTKRQNHAGKIASTPAGFLQFGNKPGDEMG